MPGKGGRFSKVEQGNGQESVYVQQMKGLPSVIVIPKNCNLIVKLIIVTFHINFTINANPAFWI